MTIRPETAADFPALYQFIKTAFETAKVSNGTEQDFTDRLRASGNYLPELSLVAEEDGKIVGHVMLSKGKVSSERGAKDVLILAPLSVALAQRGKGLGAKLVRDVLKRASAQGWKACMLVGDPAYYGRFGFKCSADVGITAKKDIPAQYVLACRLVPGAFKHLRGTVDFPA